ncbi:MAG: aspartyl protease family protein [Verrucomicrobia bacterium]|nr:aspartyl protease family protein [Verrucomicrobiota bacterium]
MPGEANKRKRERPDEAGRLFVFPIVCFPARRLFHFVSCLSSFAVLLLCGCAGLQDARSERLPPTSVEQMRAHRVQPEIVGFGTMKAGANTISFTAHSWLDGAETTTLPMTDAMSRGDTHAMVDAVLNDGVRVPMLVDTGAASDVLSPSLVEKLKLPLFDTGNETATVRGVGGEQAVFPGGLSKLRLGGIEVHNTVVVVLTEQYRQYGLGMFRGQTVDSGIIGMNTLSRFRWVTFDWRRRQLTLGRVGDYKPDERKLADAIPFDVVYGKLVVGAEINKANRKSSLSLMLDTGSDDEMMLPMKVAQELQLFDVASPPTNRRWISGVGGSYIGSPFVVGAVKIGRLQFIKVNGHTVPDNICGVFGNKLMRQFKTTFDFAHRRLVFERY